jgi:predicted N-formylglutamate amidohydrolase
VGNVAPDALGRLGVPESNYLERYAWDIGIAGACRVLPEALDAAAASLSYSRVVIDCSCRSTRHISIPIGELTGIPGSAKVASRL